MRGQKPIVWKIGFLALMVAFCALIHPVARAGEPVRVIFDTDLGNDIDDSLALGVIHALQSRAECRLLAVTVTKQNELSAAFVDLINTFYGRGDIPIGAVRDGKTPELGRYLELANQKDGDKLRFPHDLLSGKDAPDATELLRRVLIAQPDQSVAIVQVGFSTNLARLLDTKPDAQSPLNGRELVKQKVKALSLMAGSFRPIPNTDRKLEYNVKIDIPAAKKIAEEWPTPMIFSGFEIGLAIPFLAQCIESDFGYVEHHPLAEGYRLYRNPLNDSPSYDLTSVLWAVRPDRGYFDLSPKGRVIIEDDGYTRFEEDPNGRCQYLIVSPDQVLKAREALMLLAGQPPSEPRARTK